MSETHGRRDLFTPQSLGKLLSTVTGGEWTATSQPSRGMLCRAGRDAMATRFEVVLDMLDMDLLDAAEKGLDRILELESQMTVYREDSEVSRLNREAFERPVQVEEQLFALFDRCRILWAETGGCFDIALHALLKEWGLFKGPRRQPDPSQIEEQRSRSGLDKVVLDPKTRTVRFTTQGVGINLAAVGKGYALDRAAERMTAAGLKHFLIHGGNSSMLGRGTSTWDRGWLIDLAHPLDWSVSLGQVRLINQALSTSALGREAVLEGKTPHVLDPRTGRTVETDLISVSVLTTSGADAEGLSTALLVMGLDKAVEYCENHNDLGAALIRWDRRNAVPELTLTTHARRYVEVLS